jgi:hypothetical protein
MDDERMQRIMAGYAPAWSLTVTSIADHLYCGHGIIVTCPDCRHEEQLDLLAIAEKVGRDTAVDAVLRALECSTCKRCGRPGVIVTSQENRPKRR